MVRRGSGCGFGGPTFHVGVACCICVERCPFEVEIMAKMREAAALFEGQAA